jgi:D-alanine-D-alanine ligase-like ATP-grasp enzyme
LDRGRHDTALYTQSYSGTIPALKPMKNHKKISTLGRILQKVAPKIGATVFMEPVWGMVGQITFKNGKNSYFQYSALNINPMGSSKIARDKDYANFFMQSMGYPVVPGSKTFFSDEWGKTIGVPKQNKDAGYIHAKTLGFPVIVKPNSGSQGSGVSLVHNKKEFYEALYGIFEKDRVALVQKPVLGKDYRLVVLGNKMISAYERIPLNVVGDGVSTVRKLLRNKQICFTASGRNTQIKENDPRIKNKLLHQQLTYHSVPTKDQKVYLLDNANLSTGGDSVDVTDVVHPVFKKLAIELTRDMGLRFCGVDLMIQGDISKKTDTFWILEINSAPGLDHYSKIGKEQEKIVEDLYLEVLKHMER